MNFDPLVRPAAALLLGTLSCALWAQTPPTGSDDGDAPAQMEPLLVTAALEPLSARDVASSVTVITREEIEQKQVKVLADLLRDVPGFNVSQAGGPGTQTQVRVRGAEANHLLVLVDGIRANDPASADEFQYQYALTANIERIEIIRGPQSSIWGSDAVAGVINIIRRKDVDTTQWGGRAEVGSFDTVDVALDGSWRGSGGLELRGGVSRHETDGINIARMGDEKDGASNTTLDAGLEYAFTEAVRASVSGQYVDASSDFDAIDFVITGLPTDADRVTEAERRYLRSALDWAPPGGAWSGNASVNWTDTDNLNLADGAFTSSTAAEVLDTRLRASVLWPGQDEGQEHRMTFAMDHVDTDFSQRGIASPFGDPNQDQSYDQTSFAAEYVGRWFEGFTMTLSGRHNSFSDFDNIGTWQIGASHEVQEGVRVRGSYGTGMKVPTFTERFGFFEDFFIGNPDLKPEQSRGWEFGLEWTLPVAGLVLGGAYFDTVLQDEIDGFVFDPDTFLFTAANKDSDSDRNGFEVTLDSRPLPGLTLGASYTYTDATESDFTGQAVRELRRPRHMGSLSANYRFADDRANLNLNVNHTGKQFDVFFDPATFIGETVELSSYTVADMAGSWRLTPSLELVGRISNLTDEDYEEVLGFSRPGRAYYAGIRGRFDF